MATITSTGLGSGLDIANIVSKLVAAEQTPQTTILDKREAKDQAQISALGTFKSALSDFKTAVGAFKNATSFSQMQGTSSDTSVLTASASLNADVGNYAVTVKQLAQAHGLASKAYAAPSDVVGTGTLTIKFGTMSFDGVTHNPNGFTQNAEKGTLTLDIDASNNTLTGVRDAINKANAGIQAAIINDGTGNRLVLTSKDSGAKNGMEITVTDNDGDNTDSGGLSALAFNAGSVPRMTQTQAAQDAIVNINGLDVTSTSNTVSSAMKGVSINLLKAQPGQSVNLGIAANTDGITKAVQSFVEKFNAVATTVNSVASYDSTTKKAGVLLGDFAVLGAMRQLRNLMSQPVPGLDGSIRTLQDIGITTTDDGTLSLNTSKLSSAIASNKNDVVSLFAPFGVPSDGNITYIGKSADTKPGTYALNVTAAATRGTLSGVANPSLVIDGSNNSLQIKVDGVSSNVLSLTQSATYTPGQLAAELQSRINGDSTLKSNGVGVTVQYDSTAQTFSIQSQRYGSASSVEILQIGAGGGATVAGLGVGAGTQGQDAQATLDGEAVQASGRLLTGATGASKGLMLELGDDATGSRGTVRFTSGLVSQFDQLFEGMLGTKGTVSSRITALETDVSNVGTDRKKLGDRMIALQKQLLTQFNAMDQLVARFQSTSSYLTQQISTLPYSNSDTFTR